MNKDIKLFETRLGILFKNLGYFIESTLVYRELIIMDLKFATTGEKINIIYVKSHSLYEKYKKEIKEYKKDNTVLIFDKKVPKKSIPFRVWSLADLADIEKCGFLGCSRVPASLFAK